MDEILSVAGLRKSYGAVEAVRGIDFSVRGGEIVALLGPNGAGKTSALECIEGLRRPDAGSIRVLGLDPARSARALARQVGVQLQSQSLPPAMTVRESLGFFARYRGVEPDADAALELGLGEKLDSQISTLSTGQQRRLALALAIQHRPRLVVLDEPTAGLDVETRDRLHALMQDLRSRGTSILLASHDMAEVEKLADRALVLVRGSIAASGSPRELTSGGEGLTRITVSTRDGTVVRERPALSAGAVPAEGVSRETRPARTAVEPVLDGEYAVYLGRDPGTLVRELLRFIEDRGDAIVDLRVERPSLEERFLEIVGRNTK